MVADAISTATARFMLPRITPIYLPYGWEPVDAALSWIAFGTALPRSEWDQYLFIGASDSMTRLDVLRSLEQLAAEPGGLDGFLAGAPETGRNLDEVPPSVRDEVGNLASILRARQARRGGAADLARFTRCAARLLEKRYERRFAADPRWDGYVDADMEALAAAERYLLSRGADGSAPLFAWPGGPKAEPQVITAPRQRISPELCAAPVSFDRDFALLPCLRSDARQSALPLFHSIVIPADVLLALRPKAEPVAGLTSPEPEISVEAGRRGGDRLSRQVAAANLALGAKLAAEGLHGRGGQAVLERWFIAFVADAGGETSLGRARVHVARAIAAHRRALDMDR
jgi:hypothetical protein